VRESRSLGSVRGDRGNPVPYREQQKKSQRISRTIQIHRKTIREVLRLRCKGPLSTLSGRPHDYSDVGRLRAIWRSHSFAPKSGGHTKPIQTLRDPIKKILRKRNRAYDSVDRQIRRVAAERLD
jgi:hypothetical protein